MDTVNKTNIKTYIDEIKNLIGRTKMNLTRVQDVSTPLVAAWLEPAHFMLSDVFRKTTILKRLIDEHNQKRI